MAYGRSSGFKMGGKGGHGLSLKSDMKMDGGGVRKMSSGMHKSKLPKGTGLKGGMRGKAMAAAKKSV